MSLKPNSPWPGILHLFPARGSLVSDIPVGDGKNDNLFYSLGTKVYTVSSVQCFVSKGVLDLKLLWMAKDQFLLFIVAT
jgi:hypothetical protein